MQSVPSEFVTHLRPLLFVAGLGGEQSQEQPVQASSDPATANETPTFSSLVQSLRQVLTAKRSYAVYDARAARGQGTDFNVILVDKAIRFPPRKARLPNNKTGPHSPISPFTTSSPLYPDGLIAPIWIRKHRELVPSVFILVLRLYEFGAKDDMQGDDKSGSTSASGTLERETVNVGPLDKEKLEKAKDADIVQEIVNRKRLCSERGIKLAVVLLTSRELLDDPALDPRLSAIRRASTLDSRASLFVLSPVAQEEVQNFVASLKSELFESAIDYYREHGRRLRRKRSRPVNAGTGMASSVMMSSASSAGTPAESQENRGLSSHALSVRYEYKAATFAEFRGEMEVALKHYEDCYSALSDLFVQRPGSSSTSSTSNGANQIVTILYPRTKRWAEARVLSDCLSIRIAKCYLYVGNPTFAVAQYRNHIKNYSRLARDNWSMGEASFEYWSWASKQHRMFADLLEAAIRAGYKIPPLPNPSLASSTNTRAPPQHHPSHVLQHPGFPFYMAALSAIRRKDCFQKAATDFEHLQLQQRRANGTEVSEASIPEPPALRHERSIPHSAQIVELLTLAYEYFKKAKATRVTLFLASRIAEIHAQDGNMETSAKFNERVARTYRRERWQEVLGAVLDRSTQAARRPAKRKNTETSADEQLAGPSVVDSDSAARLLLERLAMATQNTPPTKDSSSSLLLQQLCELYRTSDSLSASSPLTLDSSEHVLPFRCHTLFWSTRASLGENVPFQIHLDAPAFADSPQDFQYQSVKVSTSGEGPVYHVTQSSAAEAALLVPLSTQVTTTADLTVDANGKKVFGGFVSSQTAASLSIESVTLELRICDRPCIFIIRPSPSTEARWLCPADESEKYEYLPLSEAEHRSLVRFGPRNINLSFDVLPLRPAYLSENYAIQFSIVNNDSIPIALSLHALLQPFSSPQGSVSNDVLRTEDTSQAGSASISGHPLEDRLEPRGRTTKKIYLQCIGHPGTRVVDLSLSAKPASEADLSFVTTTESARQVSVNAGHPFFCDFRTTFYNTATERSRRQAGLFSLEEPDQWDNAYEAQLALSLGGLGPTELEVLAINMEFGPSQGIRITNSTLKEEDGQLPCVFEPEDPFTIMFDLDISQAHTPAATAPPGVLEILWRRTSSGDTAYSTAKTLVPIPAFNLPQAAQDISEVEPFVITTMPCLVTLHKPFKVSYKLAFPPSVSESFLSKPRIISFQTESATDNFVFSGPRKMDRLTVLPALIGEDGKDSILAEYTFVPIGNTGLLELPQFRAVEILDTPAMEKQRRRQRSVDPEDSDWYEGPRIRDLKVLRAQALSSSEPTGERLSVFVVPR